MRRVKAVLVIGWEKRDGVWTRFRNLVTLPTFSNAPIAIPRLENDEHYIERVELVYESEEHA